MLKRWITYKLQSKDQLVITVSDVADWELPNNNVDCKQGIRRLPGSLSRLKRKQQLDEEPL